MRFLALTLENFKPFRKRVELLLADQGLVLVAGDNRVSQAMSANGVGKTALFSGLVWTRYGETLEGERADEVACRFTDGPCRGVLTLDSGAEIVRGRRPKELRLLGRGYDGLRDDKEIQATINDLLGYGLRTCRNAEIFGQGNFDRFARAETGEKMRMLDEIQGLDFRAALDRAKSWRDEWRAKLSLLENDAGKLEARLAEMCQSLTDLERAKAEFAERHDRDVGTAAARYEEAKTAAAQAAARVRSIEAELAKAQKLLVAWRERRELDEHVLAARMQEKTARSTLVTAEGIAKRVEDQIASVLKQKACPTCRRPVGKADHRLVEEGFSFDRKKAAEDVSWAKGGVVLASRMGSEAEAALVAHQRQWPQDLSEAGLVKMVNDRAVDAARSLLEQAEHARDTAREVLVERRRECWTGEGALLGMRGSIAHAEADAAKNNAAQVKAWTTVQVAEYWTEAFGDRGIRSLLFDSVAGFLAERAAYHLSALAAGEAQVEISALAPLKGGGTKERLYVNAAWAWGASTYGASSAGQGGRIDLALFSALQDLAESRSAKPLALKIFDEPECHFDGRGLELLAAWVRAEARERGTALLATHNEGLLSLLDADRVWTVVLDRDGARVEVG